MAEQPSSSQKQARVELSILLYGDSADIASVPEAYPWRAEVIELPTPIPEKGVSDAVVSA